MCVWEEEVYCLTWDVEFGLSFHMTLDKSEEVSRYLFPLEWQLVTLLQYL